MRFFNRNQSHIIFCFSADYGLIHLSVQYKKRVIKLCDQAAKSRLVAAGLFHNSEDNKEPFGDVTFEQFSLFELKLPKYSSNGPVVHAFSFRKCLQQEGEPLYVPNEENQSAKCLYGLFRNCQPGVFYDRVNAYVFDNHFSRISLKKTMLENKTRENSSQ